MFYGKEEKKPQILLYTEIDEKIYLVLLEDYVSQKYYPFQFVATDGFYNPKFYGLELFFQRLLMIREIATDSKGEYLPYWYNTDKQVSHNTSLDLRFTETGEDNQILIVKIELSQKIIDQLANKFFLFQEYIKEEFSNRYNRIDLIDYDPVPQGSCSTSLMLRFVSMDSLQIQPGIRYRDFEPHVVEAICKFKSSFEKQPEPPPSPIVRFFRDAANKVSNIINGNGHNNGSSTNDSPKTLKR